MLAERMELVAANTGGRQVPIVESDSTWCMRPNADIKVMQMQPAAFQSRLDHLTKAETKQSRMPERSDSPLLDRIERAGRRNCGISFAMSPSKSSNAL